MRDPSIAAAKPKDLAGILALLRASNLPTNGLRDSLATAIVAHDGQSVVGSAALELYGDSALLRSVAVAEHLRGKGLGRRLAAAALELAKERRVATVYLLTETASAFFARMGFAPIARADVATAVQRSAEFTTACPKSAQAMVLRVGR